MIKTTSTELKINLGKYLDFIQSGEEILISRNGKFIAKMTSINKKALKNEAFIRIQERSEEYSIKDIHQKEVLKKELKKKYD